MTENNLNNIAGAESSKDLKKSDLKEEELDFSFEDLEEAIENNVAEIKTKVGLLVDTDLEVFNKLLADLESSQSSAIEMNIENSQNQFLGAVSEAEDIFESKRQEIINANRSRV